MKSPRLLTALLLAAMLSGCASTQQATASSQTPKQPEKEEYVEYTPLGSWVTKKVKKSQVKTSEQLTQQNQDGLRNLQSSAPGYPAGTGR